MRFVTPVLKCQVLELGSGKADDGEVSEKQVGLYFFLPARLLNSLTPLDAPGPCEGLSDLVHAITTRLRPPSIILMGVARKEDPIPAL